MLEDILTFEVFHGFQFLLLTCMYV